MDVRLVRVETLPRLCAKLCLAELALVCALTRVERLANRLLATSLAIALASRCPGERALELGASLALLRLGLL